MTASAARAAIVAESGDDASVGAARPCRPASSCVATPTPVTRHTAPAAATSVTRNPLLRRPSGRFDHRQQAPRFPPAACDEPRPFAVDGDEHGHQPSREPSVLRREGSAVICGGPAIMLSSPRPRGSASTSMPWAAPTQSATPSSHRYTGSTAGQRPNPPRQSTCGPAGHRVLVMPSRVSRCHVSDWSHEHAHGLEVELEIVEHEFVDCGFVRCRDSGSQSEVDASRDLGQCLVSYRREYPAPTRPR